jgi:putative transposase
VSAATLLGWHRRLVKRRSTDPHRRTGRRPLAGRVERLVVRLARANPAWGSRRSVGEPQRLGISVSATSVRAILLCHGLPPAPQRDELSWRNFLRQQAATTLACEFFTVETAWLKPIYLLFFVSLERRRIEFIACTPNPPGARAARRARKLLMMLAAREQPLRFLIHDRDSNFSGGCDHVFQRGAIAVIGTPVQAPNANAHAERLVGSVRRERLERLLVFSRRQLEHVLRVSARHYDQHRPHRALARRPPSRPTEPRYRCERHPFRSSSAPTCSAGRSTKPYRARVSAAEKCTTSGAGVGAGRSSGGVAERRSLSGRRDVEAALAEAVALRLERDHGGVADEPLDEGGCGTSRGTSRGAPRGDQAKTLAA